MYFFSVRVVNHWHDLPQEAFEVTTVTLSRVIYYDTTRRIF